MPTTGYKTLERIALQKRSAIAVGDALIAHPAAFAKQKRFLNSLGRRICLCALTGYAHTYRDNQGRLVPVVSNKRACNSRQCPTCEAKRAKSLLRRVRAELKYIFQAHSHARAIFLTTTERSAAQGNLAKVLTAHIKAIKSLFALPRVANNILGHYSAVEIAPRTDDAGAPTFGVHSHHLLLVPNTYWTRGYIRQTEWVRLFRRARGLPYNPIVDVRLATTAGHDDPLAASTAAARDLIKYFVKPSAFAHDGTTTSVDPATVAELAIALKGKHLHRRGGCFLASRKAISALDLPPDDEPATSPPPEPHPAQRLHYSRA